MSDRLTDDPAIEHHAHGGSAPETAPAGRGRLAANPLETASRRYWGAWAGPAGNAVPKGPKITDDPAQSGFTCTRKINTFL